MGQEILYCSKCQVQLRSADFEKERAYRLNGAVSCYKCARELIHSLPPQTIKQLIGEIASKEEESAERKKYSTSRILRVAEIKPVKSPGLRAVRDPSSLGNSGGVITAAVVGLVALGGIGLWMGSGSGPARPIAQPSAPPVGRELPKEATIAPPEPTPPQKPDAGGTFEADARESLLRARTFATSHPEDAPGQVRLYETAVWVAAGTSLLDTARRELDEAKRKDRDLALREIQGLLEEARAAGAREEFGIAMTLLKRDREKHLSNEWTGPIDQMIQDLRNQAVGLFGTLKGSAKVAAEKNAAADLKAIRERIARWDLEVFRTDLEKEIASVHSPSEPGAPPAPRPSRSPEAAALEASWTSALEEAESRNYAEASRILEQAVAKLSDPLLRKEGEADLEVIRLAASVYQTAFQTLSAWPKDQKVMLRVLDPAGVPVMLEASALRVMGSRLEVRSGKDVQTIGLGDLEAPGIAEIWRKSPNRRPAEGNAVTLFFLMDGDLTSARAALAGGAPPIPRKYWDWAAKDAERRASPEVQVRESEARRRLTSAERDYAFVSSRANAALEYRLLQKDFGDCLCVRRNAASIAERSEAPKEYVFLAEDLAGAGAFRWAETKTGACWTTESETPAVQRKNTYVEIRFSVVPEQTYRAWVYAGGCCAETLTFFAQGTEMKGSSPESHGIGSFEPGDDAACPVRQTIVTSPRAHASHGGKKQPTRWGWAEIPLPKYASGGQKVLRILSDQQGFSIQIAIVSAVRSSPLAEPELRELQKLRGPSPASRLDSGLVGYWKFDEGKGTVASDSSPGRNAGTFASGASWTDGRMGGALQLSGPNACIRVSASSSLADLGPLTLSAWIKPSRLLLGRVLAKEDASRGRWIFIAGETGIAFAKDFSQQELRRQTVANLLPVGVWSHIAVTWDGSSQPGQIHLYLNAAEAAYSVTQEGKGTRMSDASIPLQIGNRADLGRGFEGAIDELRIYNRVLTAAEIGALATIRSK